ncbi:MAG: CPBP family intramembrane metalloprotease [Cyclobacteriaceae bacterium]|nr:CPBP family intramembrane metalloprotease [Cyclobacteriaceae bacterium]
MDKKEVHRIGGNNFPGFHALLFLLFAIIGFVVIGPVIGTLFASFIFEGNPIELQQKIANPVGDPSMKWILFIIQGCATGIGLILLPYLYVSFVDKKPMNVFCPNPRLNSKQLGLSVLVVFLFMVVNSFFIEWNQSLTLPESMSDIESWMRSMEDRAKDFTEYLTVFDSPAQFALALIVIAVLPAIGEELVFRGYLQTEFNAAFRNPHIAIWLSAILFSAIHMQFFGFVPRLLLGALFGYLYWWSGNLLYPITAHLVQNGSQVIIMYMVQLEIIDVDVDSTESFPLYLILLFAALTVAVIYNFRKLSLVNKITNG